MTRGDCVFKPVCFDDACDCCYDRISNGGPLGWEIQDLYDDIETYSGREEACKWLLGVRDGGYHK